MINDIIKTLKHAKACHEAWWQLYSGGSDPARISSFQKQYYVFTETVKPALYTTFVVKLASLYDQRGDSISLKTLMESMALTGVQFKSDKIDFEDLWKKGRRLYKYRSKVIAHRDINIKSKNFAKATGFKYNDLKTLLDNTCTLIDEALHSMHRKRFHRLPIIGDMERLFKELNF